MDDVDETLQRALVEFSEKENQQHEIERVASLYPNLRIELAEEAAKRIVCPSCGKKAGVDILYGYPSGITSSNTILGGCIVRKESPKHGCLHCSHRWGPRD
jgi:hypothetical protein